MTNADQQHVRDLFLTERNTKFINSLPHTSDHLSLPFSY